MKERKLYLPRIITDASFSKQLPPSSPLLTLTPVHADCLSKQLIFTLSACEDGQETLWSDS